MLTRSILEPKADTCRAVDADSFSRISGQASSPTAVSIGSGSILMAAILIALRPFNVKPSRRIVSVAL